MTGTARMNVGFGWSNLRLRTIRGNESRAAELK